MSQVRSVAINRSFWQYVRLAGLAVLVATAVLAVFSTRANAQTGPCGTLTSGNDVYINCVIPPATAPYTTYTDGQMVDMAMGPNTVFSPSDAQAGDIEAIECEYVTAGGTPGDPPNENYCEAQTAASDFPYPVQTDGSFDYTADEGGDLVGTYALPDSTFPGSTITCNATNPCVWYVGEDYNSFTEPHVFSNPFFVTSSTTTTTTTAPTTTTTPPTTTTTAHTTTTTTAPTTTTTTTPTTTTTTATTPTTTTTTAPTTTTTTAPTTTTTSPDHDHDSYDHLDNDNHDADNVERHHHDRGGRDVSDRLDGVGTGVFTRFGLGVGLVFGILRRAGFDR